jgi:hypothetical protein
MLHSPKLLKVMADRVSLIETAELQAVPTLLAAGLQTKVTTHCVQHSHNGEGGYSKGRREYFDQLTPLIVLLQ